MFRGQGFTVGSTMLANMPKAAFFLGCMSQYSWEEFGDNMTRLKLGSCLLPGLALFYPLELARMHLMTDVSETKRGGFTLLKEIAAQGNSVKATYHGFGPYMAHHTLTFSLYMAISSYITPLLGPVATIATYPLNTIWARMAIEAGSETKKFNTAIECFEHIMDKESPKNLWAGYGVYAARNSLLWIALWKVFSAELD